MRKLFRGLFAILVLALIVIQFMPYGRNHTNPPVTGSPTWVSPEVEQLARRACFDCHSNETKWPWYANVAPVSWRVQHHVDEGREHLNFSEFDKPQRDADEAAEMVASGEMPLRDYLLAHPEARLSDAETTQLIDGFKAMFGESSHARGGESEHDHDDH